MNKITKKIGVAGMFVMLVVLVSNSILAFAVSSAYYPGYPLKMSPGETKDLSLVLQNLDGVDDIRIKIEIIKGLEVLELTDENDVYLVPKGKKTKVNLRATIPPDAKEGDSYAVELQFTEIASDLGGLSFISSIKKSFQIIVTPISGAEIREEKGVNWALWLGVSFVILIILILICFRKKKEKAIPLKKNRIKAASKKSS